MRKTALITGVAGQDGSYLADFLLRKNYRVIGIVRSRAPGTLWRLKYFNIHHRIKLVVGDLADVKNLKVLLRRYQPHEIYNLAGQSSVAESWRNTNKTFEINTVAVVQMLELLRVYSPGTRFFQASSAEIFGDTDSVITEKTRAFNPLHLYGTSKLAAHFVVKNFRDQYGLFAANGVLFTHTSPLQVDFTVAKTIARGAAKIALGMASAITLGNSAIVRDWSYAGDIVRAMWLILQQEKPSDFIMCTGTSLPIKSFAKEALRCVGIEQWEKYVVSDPLLIRKNDTKKMSASSARLRRIGWRPEISFKKLVKTMVEYELIQLQQSNGKK